MNEEENATRVAPLDAGSGGRDLPRKPQSGDTLAAELTDREQQLVRFIRAIPGWIRLQIVFLDSTMEVARLQVADALEKEINAKLKYESRSPDGDGQQGQQVHAKDSAPIADAVAATAPPRQREAGSEPADSLSSQPRSIAQLRAVVSTLCHYIWNKELRPGEHLWTIPVDKERDFDCILSDAIDELEQLRAGASPGPHPLTELRTEEKNDDEDARVERGATSSGTGSTANISDGDE